VSPFSFRKSTSIAGLGAKPFLVKAQVEHQQDRKEAAMDNRRPFMVLSFSSVSKLLYGVIHRAGG